MTLSGQLQLELGILSTVQSYHTRRMNTDTETNQARTEKVRVRQSGRARPQAPAVRTVSSVSSLQPEDFIVAQGEIIYHCPVIVYLVLMPYLNLSLEEATEWKC